MRRADRYGRQGECRSGALCRFRLRDKKNDRLGRYEVFASQRERLGHVYFQMTGCRFAALVFRAAVVIGAGVRVVETVDDIEAYRFAVAVVMMRQRAEQQCGDTYCEDRARGYVVTRYSHIACKYTNFSPE